MSREVVVVPTGTANTASVLAALERAGATPRLAEDAGAVAAAAYAVLPGVGAFASASARLAALGLDGPIAARVAAGRPTLAICLGLQLLGVGSEEGGRAAGLGVLDATARRFPAGLRVPHLGWSRVEPGSASLLEPGDAYFAHSFRLERAPSGWTAATSDHGGRFVAALERGAVLACQFHPELSGDYGARLIARWLDRGEEVA